MLICRVVGSVVSTAKDRGFVGTKLLMVQPTHGGETLVATDTVGAGVGETVLVSIGSAARATEQTKNAPTDATIVGIVDRIDTPGGGDRRPTKKEK